MTQIDPGRPQQPIVSNTSMALIVYILYFVAYFVGITAIVGVIIAHVQKGSGDAVLDSHYDFQIRTFWIGILYLVVGFVLMFVLIGFLVWALVVHLVADQEHQGHSGAEREPPDRQSEVLAVRLSATAAARLAAA